MAYRSIAGWLLAVVMLAGCGGESGPGPSATTSTAGGGGDGGAGGKGGEGGEGGQGGDGGAGGLGGAGGGEGGAGGGGGAPKTAWSRSYGAGKSDVGRAVAVDVDSNIAVTGHFAETMSFGNAMLTAAGFEDAFVLKLDTDGNPLWGRAFGGAEEDDEGLDVAFDSAGNMILVAAFQGSADFGGGPLASAGEKDLALVKMAPDGTHLWSQRIGNGFNDSYAELAVLPSGDIALAGDFKGTLDLGGGPLVAGGNSRSVFVARFDSKGALVWAKSFDDISGTGVDVTGIAGGAGGEVVLTGDFVGSIDFINFGGGTLVSAGASDAYVVKLDAAGKHVWSKRFGGDGSEVPDAVAVDGSGHVLLTGAFEGAVDFGGGPLVSAEAKDLFVIELDAGGVHVASRRFGGALDQGASGIASSAGKVALTGTFDGSVDFGGGALVSAGGLGDVLVAAFGGVGGNHLWSASYGDGALSTQAGRDVVIDAFGAVIVAGTFGSTLDFGAGPHKATHVDVFLAKYAP